MLPFRARPIGSMWVCKWKKDHREGKRKRRSVTTTAGNAPSIKEFNEQVPSEPITLAFENPFHRKKHPSPGTKVPEGLLASSIFVGRRRKPWISPWPSGLACLLRPHVPACSMEEKRSELPPLSDIYRPKSAPVQIDVSPILSILDSSSSRVRYNHLVGISNQPPRMDDNQASPGAWNHSRQNGCSLETPHKESVGRLFSGTPLVSTTRKIRL